MGPSGWSGLSGVVPSEPPGTSGWVGPAGVGDSGWVGSAGVTGVSGVVRGVNVASSTKRPSVDELAQVESAIIFSPTATLVSYCT